MNLLVQLIPCKIRWNVLPRNHECTFQLDFSIKRTSNLDLHFWPNLFQVTTNLFLLTWKPLIIYREKCLNNHSHKSLSVWILNIFISSYKCVLVWSCGNSFLIHTVTCTFFDKKHFQTVIYHSLPSKRPWALNCDF